MRSAILVLCLALLASPLPAADKPAEKHRFTPLFDGKTFRGWEGDVKIFRIEDRAVGGGSLKQRVPRNEFLCT
jgi:hypothetical protein